MNVPLLRFPSSPIYPGIYDLIVVPGYLVPDYVRSLADLRMQWFPTFSLIDITRVECDGVPEMEIKSSCGLLSSDTKVSLSFTTRKIELIPVGCCFMVLSEAFGLLLLHSNVAAPEVSVASRKPDGDPLTFKVEIEFLAPPVQIDQNFKLDL